MAAEVVAPRIGEYPLNLRECPPDLGEYPLNQWEEC